MSSRVTALLVTAVAISSVIRGAAGHEVFLEGEVWFPRWLTVSRCSTGLIAALVEQTATGDAIFVARSYDEGCSWWPMEPLAEGATILTLHTVAVGRRALIAWTEIRDEQTWSRGVVVDPGSHESASMALTDTPGVLLLMDIASSGDVVVAAYANRGDEEPGVYLQTIDLDEGPTLPKRAPVGLIPGIHQPVQVVAEGSEWYVAFVDDTQRVRLIQSTDAGLAWIERELPSEPEASFHGGVDLAFASLDDLLVMWSVQEARGKSVLAWRGARRSDGGGIVGRIELYESGHLMLQNVEASSSGVHALLLTRRAWTPFDPTGKLFVANSPNGEKWSPPERIGRDGREAWMTWPLYYGDIEVGGSGTYVVPGFYDPPGLTRPTIWTNRDCSKPIDGAASLRLAANPARSGESWGVTVHSTVPATIVVRLLDVTGRVVHEWPPRWITRSPADFEAQEAPRVAAGVYWWQAIANGTEAVRPQVVLD